MGKTSKKQLGRLRRKLRIRQRIFGSPERPRLCVFKSTKHLYAQIIDDTKGHTLIAASSMDKEFKRKIKATVAGAKEIGKLLAKRALQKGVKKIIFDRSGFRYRGRLKALADSLREEGVEF